MDLPEAQAIIKDMDIDFRKWFEANPWKKSSKAKGEFFEWIKVLLEAQRVIDAEIAWNLGGFEASEKILNQNKFRITPALEGYGIISGLKPKGKHYLTDTNS